MRSLRRPDGSFRIRPETHLPPLSDEEYPSGFDAAAPRASGGWLTPVLTWGVERLVGVGRGQELQIIDASSGLSWGSVSIPRDDAGPPTTALLIDMGSGQHRHGGRLIVLTHTGPRRAMLDLHSKVVGQTTSYRWLHGPPGFDPSRPSPITWRHVPPFLEVQGLDTSGAVFAAQFHLEDGSLELLAERSSTTEGGYLATVRRAPTRRSPSQGRASSGSRMERSGSTSSTSDSSRCRRRWRALHRRQRRRFWWCARMG